MTREEVSQAIANKTEITDWLGDERGTLTGWANADTVEVVWNDGSKDTISWDEISIA